MSLSNGVNSHWFCSKYQLLNHTELFRKHPSKPEDIKLWGNFQVVKGLEIHSVSRTTHCRGNAVLSQWENRPPWGIPHSSNQTLTLWANRAAAVPGTAARPKPDHPADLLSLSEVTLYFRDFSFTLPPSAAARPPAAGDMGVGTYARTCVHTAALPSSRTAFPGVPWAACELAGHEQHCMIASGLSIDSCVG